jgi:hypothetical protein
MLKLSPFAIPQSTPTTGVYTRAYFQQLPHHKKERLSLKLRSLIEAFSVENLRHRRNLPPQKRAQADFS